GGPVVEVDFAPQLLARPGGQPAPGIALDQLLVPGLETVEGRGEEPGDRGADQQVVEVAFAVLDDPFPLFVVDDRPPPVLQHPRRPRVYEDRTGAAEVAAEAPAGA